MKRLDCEYHLRPGEGELQTEIGRGSGPIALGAVPSHGHGPSYGKLLFNALFPPGSELLREYQKAEREARSRKEGLRFRLCLDPELDEKERDLPWEELYDREALALSPQIAFSRFIPVEEYTGTPIPELCRPRVLVAIADFPDLHRFRLPRLNREEVSRSLEGFLKESYDCELLEPPTTLTALHRKLREGRFHVLHLIAHGLPPTQGEAGLVLQGEDELIDFIRYDEFVEIFSESQGLRLIVVSACHSAAVRREDPFPGLAERLVQRGIPAVIVMRREISVLAAEIFAKAVYIELAKSGEVDVVTNAARQELYADSRTRIEWSNFMLLLGLRDARIWQKPPQDSASPVIPLRIPKALSAISLGVLGLVLASLSPRTGSLPLQEPSHPIGTVRLPVTAETVTEPESEPEGKIPEPASGPSPPSAIAREVLQKIDDARRYRDADTNIEEALRLYKEALAELPVSARRSLNQPLLAKAENLRNAPASEAVKEYGALLDPLLQSSSTDVTQGESNQ